MQKPLARILVIAAAVSAVQGSRPVHAQGEDADFKKEERFHKIYKKYNEQPTSTEAWEKALSNRKANTYPIQKDDTLWDISRTFFGDSNYWPKIWSYNTENILNPHEISPKNMIKFYPGTKDEAPTIGLADAKAEPEAMPDKVIEKTPAGGLEGIVIPPPKRKSRPLVKHLPNSLPLYRLGAVNKAPVEFEAQSLVRKIPVPEKFLSHYVADTEIKSIGEVVEAEIDSGVMAADYQYIVVRLSDPTQKNLLAYKDETTVSDPFVMLGSSATVIEVQGEIEVLEKVSDSDNLYRAMVKRVINPLEVGSKLIAGKLQKFNAAKTATSSSVQAKIIGGEYHRYIHRLYGYDNVVFLNAGAKEGLQEGSCLPIYLNEKLRNSSTHAVINDRVIGTVKIIKLAEHFATGYILQSDVELMVGDYVGGRSPSAGSTASASSSEESLETDDAPPKSEPAEAPAEPRDDLKDDSAKGSGGDDDLQL